MCYLRADICFAMHLKQFHRDVDSSSRSSISSPWFIGVLMCVSSANMVHTEPLSLSLAFCIMVTGMLISPAPCHNICSQFISHYNVYKPGVRYRGRHRSSRAERKNALLDQQLHLPSPEIPPPPAQIPMAAHTSLNPTSHPRCLA